MTKKTILFIGLTVCFLGVLAYVENIEKQKQEKLGQLDIKQTEISRTKISEAKEEINWENITPEYFLSEDIFLTEDFFDAGTGIGSAEFMGTRNIEDIGEYKIFTRNLYDKDNVAFITITVKEFKDKNFGDYSIKEPDPSKKVFKTMIVTELGTFLLQNEVVKESEYEIIKDQSIIYRLAWLENNFNFSVETISAEYQDDIKEIAENIINKYPNLTVAH